MTNIVACLVVLTIVVQQTRCTDDLANTVSAVGANVTMRCKTRSGNCSDVIWGIGTNAISIYKGEYGFLGNYGSRYSIDNTFGCHLKIKNVQLTDAGRLSCIDESSMTTNSRSAELIVLESEPKCRVSASADTTAEGDRVDLSCEVTFGGNNSVSMTWKDMENVPPSTKTGKILGLSHAVTAERPIVPSYECVASFEIVTNRTSLVPNIPTASCKTPPIKILCNVVKNINYTATSSTFTVNYPAESTASSSTFTVNYPAAAAAIGGPDKTTVRVANASYAEDNKGSFGVGIASGFGIGFVVVLALFFFVFFFILFRLKHPQIRRNPGNMPTALTGSSEESNDKTKKEHDTTTLVQEYDYLELNKEVNTAVPSQAALPAEDATYASLQKEDEDSHCYISLAEEEKKRSQE